MSVEISTIRTAAEAARTITTETPMGLDPTTVAAVTGLLRAAADLAQANRPIVLAGPANVPAPRYETRDETPAANWHTDTTTDAHGPYRRRVLLGDRVLWFGSGMAFSGITGALVALAAGNIWVLTVSAAGALLWPVGGIAIHVAERREQAGGRA
ncbi:MAG TPA: hypothetical protein VGX23_36980 [Actinocrinis sp.]|nr:hypothetical protein [Actinocrinis sp.]